MKKKRKAMGRPPKPASEKYLTKARQLGRVDEDDWQLLQDAASASGKTFTNWAVSILIRAAKRQLQK